MINWSLYDYQLPDSLIAKTPSSPRDFSKLMVYDTKSDRIYFDKFLNLDKYLPDKTFLVLNNTKVLPARVELKKVTGGKVVCLLLLNEMNRKKGTNIISVFADRKINAGDDLYLDSNHSFKVIKQDGKNFLLEFEFNRSALYKILLKIGKTPTPLYLKKLTMQENEVRKKYQTIFAEKIGSVAAPTASLHFTNRVFTRLKKKNISKYQITLHVGRGTFAPIDESNIQQNKLHKEYFEIQNSDSAKFKTLKSAGYQLMAAGTTTVRTLESAAQNNKITGDTELFINPPYNFKMVDILLTNFHIPKSSLMMLVEAFLQHKKAKRNLLELYKIAIDNKFRFYSFGDAMLII